MLLFFNCFAYSAGDFIEVVVKGGKYNDCYFGGYYLGEDEEVVNIMAKYFSCGGRITELNYKIPIYKIFKKIDLEGHIEEVGKIEIREYIGGRR
jgi:hypothetical protein